MTTRQTVLGTLTLACCLAAATAPAATKSVTCTDGTTSKAGRGACSHHGGVAHAPMVTCKDGTTSKPGRGACSHHGGVAPATSSPQAGGPSATVPTSRGAPKDAAAATGSEPRAPAR